MNTGVLIFTALKTLVANRCYPDTFPQSPDVPVWPAIRYTGAGGTDYPDICGSGTSDEDDIRVQLDIVTLTSAERHTLTEAVRLAMAAVTPPALIQGPPSTTYDAETKTFRCTIDYIFYGSSS